MSSCSRSVQTAGTVCHTSVRCIAEAHTGSTAQAAAEMFRGNSMCSSVVNQSLYCNELCKKGFFGVGCSNKCGRSSEGSTCDASF